MAKIDPRDDDALTRYILSSYPHLLTDIEKNVLIALNIDLKTLNLESSLVKHKLGDTLERIKTSEVSEIVANGPDYCHRTIRDRLLRDHRDEILLVTCPQCGRLARTPKARMCVHCGHTWHHDDKA
jgi:hypothetical protein